VGLLFYWRYIYLLRKTNKFDNRYNIKLLHYYNQEGKTYNECEREWAVCVSELKKLKTVLDWGTYEYKFVEDCMKGKGYKLVFEHELPIDTKRRNPDRSTMGLLRGRRQGVAGTLEEE
jgi:uncharacterized protein YerC